MESRYWTWAKGSSQERLIMFFLERKRLGIAQDWEREAGFVEAMIEEHFPQLESQNDEFKNAGGWFQDQNKKAEPFHLASRGWGIFTRKSKNVAGLCWTRGPTGRRPPPPGGTERKSGSERGRERVGEMRIPTSCPSWTGGGEAYELLVHRRCRRRPVPTGPTTRRQRLDRCHGQRGTSRRGDLERGSLNPKPGEGGQGREKIRGLLIRLLPSNGLTGLVHLGALRMRRTI